MAKVTCRFCKNKIEKEHAYNPSSRVYYCSEECYNKYEEEHKPKEKVKSDFVKLTDYVQELYGNDCNFPWIMKQIKHYKDENGFKDSGILLSLKYYVEVEGNNFNRDFGLGQVLPKYYEIAKRHYVKTIEVKKQVEAMDFDDDVKIVRKASGCRKKQYKY